MNLADASIQNTAGNSIKTSYRGETSIEYNRNFVIGVEEEGDKSSARRGAQHRSNGRTNAISRQDRILSGLRVIRRLLTKNTICVSIDPVGTAARSSI